MARSYIWILMVLCTIVWATELVAQGTCGKYERTDWKHWVDEDKDCQNARMKCWLQNQQNLLDSRFQRVEVSNLPKQISRFLGYNRYPGAIIQRRFLGALTHCPVPEKTDRTIGETRRRTPSSPQT